MIDFLLSFPVFATVIGLYALWWLAKVAARRFPARLRLISKKQLLFGLAAVSYFAAVWLFNLNDINRPGVNSSVIYAKLLRFEDITPGNTLALMIAGVCIIKAFQEKSEPKGKIDIERGSRLIPFAEAQKRAAALAQGNSDLVTWGGLSLPVREASRHFAISGTTQSGKSVSIKRLMLDVLPLVGKPGYDYRALIYDYKLDFLPFALGAAPNVRVVTFNPFHADCVAWNIAADVTSPVAASQVAAILVPKNEGDGGDARFFLNSSQAVFEEVLKNFALRASPRDGSKGIEYWTLRDVMCAMKTLKRLIKFVRTDKATSDFLDSHGHEKTISNIFSDVATYRKRYSIVASLWDAPSRDPARRVSINLSSSSI